MAMFDKGFERKIYALIGWVVLVSVLTGVVMGLVISYR